MKSTRGGTTINVERALGTLAGSINALVAAGWSDAKIEGAVGEAIREGRELEQDIAEMRRNG